MDYGRLPERIQQKDQKKQANEIRNEMAPQIKKRDKDNTTLKALNEADKEKQLITQNNK